MRLVGYAGLLQLLLICRTACFYAGVELGVFEGLTTCAAGVSGATNAELLDQIMKTPLVRCDQVQFAFLGISMAGWNAILSLGGAALIAWLTLGRRAA